MDGGSCLAQEICLGQGEVSHVHTQVSDCAYTSSLSTHCIGLWRLCCSWNGCVLAQRAAQHWQSLKETRLSCCRLMRCARGKPVFHRVCSHHLLTWSVLQSGGRLLHSVRLSLASSFSLWQGQFFLLLSGSLLWILLPIICCSLSFWEWSRRSCCFHWQSCWVPFCRETVEC